MAMELWFIGIGIGLIIPIAALLLRRSAKKKAARRTKRHYEAMANLHILETTNITDDPEIVQERISAVEAEWNHYHYCERCRSEDYNAAKINGENVLRHHKLTALWKKLADADAQTTLDTLLEMVGMASQSDQWFDTVPCDFETLRRRLVTTANEWIATIDRLTPENVKSIKQKIERIRVRTGASVTFPPNWNEMIAEGIEQPDVWHFVDVPQLDFRRYIRQLRLAYETNDLAKLKLLAAIAIEQKTIDINALLRYLIVEPAEPDPMIDVIDVPALLRKVALTP